MCTCITLTVEGAEPEEIARGLAAAQAVFDRAGVTPDRAADARFNAEGWDIRGFDDDISGDDLAICTVWDEAEGAAIEACCAGWAKRPGPTAAYLKLVDPSYVPSGMAPENVTSLFMARKREIAREIRIAMERLGAPFALLEAMGRWRDGADDASVLADLRTLNETEPPTHAREPGLQIIREVYIALENLGAPPELLGEIGSWGDGEDDVDVLDGLRLFNRTGSIFTDIDIDLRTDE
mgnify:CR=1 FL=1